MKSPVPTLRRHWPYLVVIAAPLILFAPFLLDLHVLYWGTPLFQFYPWRKLAFDLLRAGEWPLWNPYLGNGAPLLANLQSAVLYPPNWLGFILPLDYSFSWLAALYWIWAGAGMVALARTLGLKPLGQAVAGLAFGLSQYLVARAWFFSINATVAWVPWVIWAGDRALNACAAGQRRAWARSAWLLALCVAMQLLAGHAQTAWYTLLLLAAWALWRMVQRWVRPALALPRSVGASDPDALRPAVSVDQYDAERRETRFPRGAWEPVWWWKTLLPALWLLLPLAGAALLAAVQLLPTAELLRQSHRANAADYVFVMTYSLSPWRLLTLFMPDVLGNPARGQFYGYGNYWEDALYVGVLPLLLAAWAMWRAFRAWLRRRRRGAAQTLPAEGGPASPRWLILFLALMLPVTLVLALGRNTPVFPFLYAHVPTFNLFQAPARMLVWLEFALALLAGAGAGQVGPLTERAKFWVRLSAAGSVSIILTGAACLAVIPSQTALGQQLQTVARALLTLGVSLLLSCVALLSRPAGDDDGTTNGGRVLGWQLAVAAFVAADLIYAGWGLNPGAAPDLYRRPPAAAPALHAALDAAPSPHRLFEFPDDEYVVKYSDFLPFKQFGPPELAVDMRASEVSNIAMVDGLASSNNYEPLVSARYADFIEVISATSSVNLLHLMDVGVIVSGSPLTLPVVTQGGPVTFYQMPGPGEPRRVRVVYSPRTVPDAAAAKAAVVDPAFVPEREVILEAGDTGPANIAPPWPLVPTVDGPIYSVSLTQPGWVVISDTCYPGWAAYVDGQPAPLRCADYAFWAVAAPAGQHTVALRYRPLSFAVGLWVSFVAWAIWAGIGLAIWGMGRRVLPLSVRKGELPT